MRTAAALACALLVNGLAFGVARAEWHEVAPGVEYDAFKQGATQVYALRIDTCGPGIRMRATAPGEGPRTTASFGELVGGFAAINGDWWAKDGVDPNLPQTTFPRGLAMGDGQHFAGTVDPPFYGFFAFGGGYRQHSVMEEDVGGPPLYAQDIVSGQPTLVWDGQLRDNPNAHCGTRRARTAVGMSADTRTVYWAVVQEIGGSTGMTCNEMGALMQSLGAHSALNQDGGGSSTMWLQPMGVVNQPSDGSPRSLVTHWSVMAPGEGPPRSCPELAVPDPEMGAVKRHVTSGDVLDAWRLPRDEIIVVPDDWLAAWPEGDPWPQVPELVRASERLEVYALDRQLRRHITDPTSLRYWRLVGHPIEELPVADVDALPEVEVLPRRPFLIQGSGPEVYVLDIVSDPPDEGGGGGGGEGGGEGDGDGTDGDDGSLAGGCQHAPASGSTWVLAAFALLLRRRRRA